MSGWGPRRCSETGIGGCPRSDDSGGGGGAQRAIRRTGAWHRTCGPARRSLWRIVRRERVALLVQEVFACTYGGSDADPRGATEDVRRAALGRRASPADSVCAMLSHKATHIVIRRCGLSPIPVSKTEHKEAERRTSSRTVTARSTRRRAARTRTPMSRPRSLASWATHCSDGAAYPHRI